MFLGAWAGALILPSWAGALILPRMRSMVMPVYRLRAKEAPMNVMLGFQMKRTDGRCGPVFLPAIVALVSSSILAAMVLFSSDALAQERDLQPLLDRLERMERDIRTLNVQLSRSGSSSSSAPASATPYNPIASACLHLSLLQFNKGAPG